MKKVIGVVRIIFLLFTLALLLSLVACIINYFATGETESSNLRLMLHLAIWLIVSGSLWLLFRAIYRSLEVKQNKNKDPQRFYRDPTSLYKKMNKEV